MKRERLFSAVAVAVSVMMLAGCQETSASKLQEIPRDEYNKISYDTTIVERGDVEPTLIVPLSLQSMEYISYTVDASDVELKEIKVSNGEYVKAGQELVVFESESLEKKVSEQRDDLSQKKMLLEHVKKMRAIDVDESKIADDENVKAIAEKYDLQISMLQDDINVSSIYLTEKEEELKKCKITAKKDGTITFISQNLLNGIVIPSSDMITETCGQVSFSSEIKDDYPFEIGDIFTAESTNWSYEVVVTEIEDVDGRSRMVYFKPVSPDVVYVGSEKFNITIEKEKLSDVVYVNKNAINKDAKGELYVFVIDGDGFRKVKYVETGTEVEGNVVVLSGLEGGEEVVLK